jgi:hypothetical protein
LLFGSLPRHPSGSNQAWPVSAGSQFIPRADEKRCEFQIDSCYERATPWLLFGFSSAIFQDCLRFGRRVLQPWLLFTPLKRETKPAIVDQIGTKGWKSLPPFLLPRQVRQEGPARPPRSAGAIPRRASTWPPEPAASPGNQRKTAGGQQHSGRRSASPLPWF